MNDKRYTLDDIVNHFTDADLKEEFKWEILGHMTGVMQAMCNIIDNPKETMIMVDTHGDHFQEAHNWFVTVFQRHYACDPALEKQTRKV